MTPQTALRISVGAALATIVFKWTAWWTTGSVAFLSEAFDSVVNLAGASFALAAVSYARRPPDSAHPYGYGKAEYFSSALEGVLILAAAAGILAVVGKRFVAPQPLQSLGLGAGLSLVAAAMNFVVAQALLRSGRKHRSLATEADGRHLMADVWMTTGVVIGVGAAGLTGWVWLDPAVAIVVAVNLVREGWYLVSFSLRGLMDAAWPSEDVQRAKRALRSLEPEEATFMRLRTRRSGARRFAFVELHVPPNWSVERADALAATAERAASEHGVVLVVRVKPSDARVRDASRTRARRAADRLERDP